MRHTNDRRSGLRWKFTSVLEDLDYADDVTLISSRLVDLQQKTDRLAATGAAVGLKTDQPAQNKDYIRTEGEEVEDVESFV